MTQPQPVPQPVLGELIGEGASSTVHAWAPGQVVKLFRPAFAALATIEAERARVVHDAGVASPEVFGIVEAAGRVGVVFERVDGGSMLDGRDRGPRLARVLAELHVDVHALRAPSLDELPQLADTLADMGIAGMPRGEVVFHGDLHPGNVLRRGDELVIIDWSNAHRSTASADVACSMLAIGYRGLREAGDADRSARIHDSRIRAADAYLAAYSERRADALDDLPLWLATIGELLLAQEPETAFAEELRDRWIPAGR